MHWRKNKWLRKREVANKIDPSLILTSKMSNKSGAASFKIIIAFKIAFLLAVEKYAGIRLPFLIDSLRTSEVH